MRNVDLFDDYLHGKLNDAERMAFESRLREDAEFENEFRTHRFFIESIQYAAGKNELKKKMNAIHEEAFGKPNVVSIEPKHNYLKVAAVAASVSLIVFFSGLLIYRVAFLKGSQHTLEEGMKKVVEYSNSIKQGFDLSQSISKKPVAPANFEATGFAISSKGYFITSLHSVKNADSVMVRNEQLDYVPAERVWEDPKLDVAIFKLKSTEGIRIKDIPLSFRSGNVELGEKVFALGYPRETVVYSEANVSAGSGLNGDTVKYQLSMLINPGNSGSPVLDEQGNVIGIISTRNSGEQGVSYAVKAAYIQEMIRNIPDEKLRKELSLNGKNTIKKLKRTEQIKKLKPYVFNVMVYNSREAEE